MSLAAPTNTKDSVGDCVVRKGTAWETRPPRYEAAPAAGLQEVPVMSSPFNALVVGEISRARYASAPVLRRETHESVSSFLWRSFSLLIRESLVGA